MKVTWREARPDEVFLGGSGVVMVSGLKPSAKKRGKGSTNTSDSRDEEIAKEMHRRAGSQTSSFHG